MRKGRQTHDGNVEGLRGTAVNAQGPSQQLWDGRLLDGEQIDASPITARKLSVENLQPQIFRRTSLKADGPGTTSFNGEPHPPLAPVVRGTKHIGQTLSHKGHEQNPPMTPPRVSGVSMAPLPGVVDLALPSEMFPNSLNSTSKPHHARRQSLGSELCLGAPASGPSMPSLKSVASLGATTSSGLTHMVKRPSALRIAGQDPDHPPQHHHHQPHHHHLLGGGRLNAGGPPGGDPSTGIGGTPKPSPQFVAEGRAVMLTRLTNATGGLIGHADVVSGAGLLPPDSPENPNLTNYREINDADSLCGTPPSLSISALTREFDADMPLGPLSPSPLSPSILTLCNNGLNAFNFNEQLDQLDHNVQAADLWMNSAYSNLPDMRECSSPYLTSGSSPQGRPTCGSA